MESGSLGSFICTNISLYVERYANIHISAWDFKLILHFSQVGGRGRHSAIVILNVELCKAFNTSQRCQPFLYSQFWSILGAWHNLHFYRSTFSVLQKKIIIVIITFPTLKLLCLFKGGKKEEKTVKIGWHFIFCLKYSLL